MTPEHPDYEAVQTRLQELKGQVAWLQGDHDGLEDNYAAVVAERDQLKKDLAHYQHGFSAEDIKAIGDERDRLRSEVAGYREALEWYAGEDEHDDCCNDYGRRALAALSANRASPEGGSE